MIESNTIRINKIAQSKIGQLDRENIIFGKAFSDHMFYVDFIDGTWQTPVIVPYGNFEMSPALSALHYGQSIFEGMKAYKTSSGEVLLFRPYENLERMNLSATRINMPTIPKSLFMDGITQLLQLDNEWVLPGDENSLYIRPLLFATDDCIGVRISDTYRLLVITSPVGPYYKHPVRVMIESGFSRASEGGVGFTKVAGNYAVSLYPTRLAQEKGYHQLIWTDSKEHKYVEECGMMNVMFYMNDTLITPTLETKTILNGVTRDSLLTLASDWGVKVEERRISVEEILLSLENGTMQEAFGAGTAATVAHFATIGYNGKDFDLAPITESSLSYRLKKELNAIKKGKQPDLYGWNVLIGN